MATRTRTKRVVDELVCAATALPICLWGAWDEHVRPRVRAFAAEVGMVARSRRR